jgi:hypothetical protein
LIFIAVCFFLNLGRQEERRELELVTVVGIHRCAAKIGVMSGLSTTVERCALRIHGRPETLSSPEAAHYGGDRGASELPLEEDLELGLADARDLVRR